MNDANTNSNSCSASIKIENMYHIQNLFMGECVLALCHNYVDRYKYFMHHMLYYILFIDVCLMAALIYRLVINPKEMQGS